MAINNTGGVSAAPAAITTWPNITASTNVTYGYINPITVAGGGTGTTTTGSISNSWAPISSTNLIHNSQLNVQSNAITLHDTNYAEIVRLNNDGSVTWAKGVNEDGAAMAFARAITTGAEMKSGITHRIKQDMRDAVFKELIDLAEEKGSITAEDMSYYWRCSKIIDKLQTSS